MLLPTQQSQGIAATGMMQSMLDGIEERRREEEEARTGRERDKVTEARIGASDEAKRAKEKIASAMFGVNHSDPNEVKVKLIERLAGKLGIDIDEARSSYRLGMALEDALKELGGAEKRALEEQLGLKEMGVSVTTLLAAIKNPYGDDNQRLMDGINRKINGGTLDTDITRVVQRLEDTADPKSLEELKLGPQGYDPTRVEDAETRAERRKDIEAAEAGEKLGDVQDTQDAIEKINTDQASTGVSAASTADADAATLISAFAAAVEQIADDQAGNSVPTRPGPIDSGDPKSPVADAEEITGETAQVVTALELGADKKADQAAIVAVRIDDIGLYELLQKKIAA